MKVKGAGGSPTEFFLCRGQAELPDAFYRIYRIFKIENTYNYIADARFTHDYLKISNFDTKNLSSPTVFEIET